MGTLDRRGHGRASGAAIDKGVYRCAVSVNGVADLRAMLASEARAAGDRSVTVRYWNRFIGVDKVAFVEKHNPPG
jgi:hypothetical protein